MKTIAATTAARLACGVATIDDPEASLPRQVRVKNRIWWKFTEIAGERGKSQWVSAYVESVVESPQAWREFRALAKARGESVAEALVKAIRLYRESE